jgi:hydroxymethylbilane synthase
MPRPAQIRLGTRASKLARWQAEWVAARLRQRDVEVELVEITTSGDRNQQGRVEQIGTQGVFTKEIQRALLDRRIDLAVHSLKDLPTEQVDGLCLAAVPERAPVHDALVSRRHGSLEQLPPGAVVGTGSLRRRAQLLHFRPDLSMSDIRGNVDTRLRKLDDGLYDAVILAEAGLRRLELAGRITQLLPQSVLLPAVGQGALGLEARVDDEETRRVLRPLDHPPSHASVVAERAMLAALHGGCMAPIAAWGRVEDGRLVLTGRVLSHDGAEKIEVAQRAEPSQAKQLGGQVAEELAAQDASRLIQASRNAG